MEDKWNQTEARIRSWIKDNKALMSVSVLVGFLLTPFLWPFFLAVVYTALSLAVPVFLILLGIKMPWRAEPHKEKKDTEKDRPENSPKDEEEDTYEQRKDTFSQGQDSKNGAAPEPEHKEKKDCADRKNNDGERDAGYIVVCPRRKGTHPEADAPGMRRKCDGDFHPQGRNLLRKRKGRILPDWGVSELPRESYGSDCQPV